MSQKKTSRLLDAAIGICRSRLREELETFGTTPLGKVVREGGRRFSEVRQDGRDLTEDDLLDFLEDLPEILGEEDDE